MLEVQKEIVKATMSRCPVYNECSSDFFIGYDEFDVPYLILPTSIGLLDRDSLYCIPFSQCPDRPYVYTLSDCILPVPLDRFTLLHDQLGFFFGPENNMLRVFLQSSTYEAYVTWSEDVVEKLIHQTLIKWKEATSENDKERCSVRLTLLLS